MDFKISSTASADEGIIRLRAIIKRLHGSITASNRGGSFYIPFLFGPLYGSFILTENYLDIHIIHHPLFVSRVRMIKLFEQINKKRKLVLV